MRTCKYFNILTFLLHEGCNNIQTFQWDFFFLKQCIMCAQYLGSNNKKIVQHQKQLLRGRHPINLSTLLLGEYLNFVNVPIQNISREAILHSSLLNILSKITRCREENQELKRQDKHIGINISSTATMTSWQLLCTLDKAIYHRRRNIRMMPKLLQISLCRIKV